MTAKGVARFFGVFLALSCLSNMAAEQEANWPQWRGPLFTGVSPVANPPLEWSETKNIKWKVATPGFGTSTPIIWQDRVFLLTAIPSGKKAAAQPEKGKTAPDANASRGGRRGSGVVLERNHHRTNFTNLLSFALIDLRAKRCGKRWRGKKCPTKAIIMTMGLPPLRRGPTESSCSLISVPAGCTVTTCRES